MAAHTIRVVGGSGGVGTSTLAAALARTAAEGGLGRVVLLDADPVGGLADHAAVLEHLAGLRWGELARLDGPVDGEALLGRLPAADRLSVLAGCGAPIPQATVAAVLAALHSTCDVLVVDGPQADLPGTARASVVLLAGLGPAEVEAARRVRSRLVDPWLVTRGPRALRRIGPEVGAHLDATWLGHLRDDPRVPRAAADGRSAATVRTVRALADRLLRETRAAA